MRSASLAYIFAVTTALGVTACGGSSEDTAENDGSALSQQPQQTKRFNVNRLAEDGDIVGATAVTAAQVQSFLQSKGSYLATYKENGSSAAQIIVNACQAQGVSPVYMLARIQVESSLVENKSSKNLVHATGCACPDGGTCSKAQGGFEKQVVCAATLMKSYFSDLDKKGKTVSGWAVNASKKTLDPCTVKPQNRATAALYTYDPWVGSLGDGCGSAKNGGSTALTSTLAGYKTTLTNGPLPANPPATQMGPEGPATPANPPAAQMGPEGPGTPTTDPSASNTCTGSSSGDSSGQASDSGFTANGGTSQDDPEGGDDSGDTQDDPEGGPGSCAPPVPTAAPFEP